MSFQCTARVIVKFSNMVLANTATRTTAHKISDSDLMVLFTVLSVAKVPTSPTVS
jgi:hypothetical protein